MRNGTARRRPWKFSLEGGGEGFHFTRQVGDADSLEMRMVQYLVAGMTHSHTSVKHRSRSV